MKFSLAVLLILACLHLNACSNHVQAEPLVGQTNQAELLSRYKGFAQSYRQFTVSKQQQRQVQNWPDDIKIDVFFGTWCHDSQREVPRLLKLLSYNTKIEITLIALDFHKADPLGLAQANNIQFTPTFVIYRQGREVGRIIERAHGLLVDEISQQLM